LSTERHCSRCNVPLGAFSPGGLCAHCLLLEGVEDAPTPSPVPALRQLGDYDLVEELARGGMGVVYKARQRGLDRMVAVKVVLAGHFASLREQARFRTEARAAAALQHPNIVAIHDVGEVDGLPYFSMDYVEGRTLAQVVADGPLEAKRPARYLKNIADAIHYAHEHGVLHRDLKPSNILIDAHDQPRVTDFGLAKRLDDAPGDAPPPPGFEATLTGETIGTPGFMPPEQVTARRGPLTPAADIYSLGAMLYHCLTGRPPFLGETIAATLHQVATAEPVPPRLLNPAVPRDLETLCLKCLAKEPQQRYATALALAEELGRFLRDEPIRARPVGRWEKFQRWYRRHPVIALLTGAVAVLLAAVAIISTVSAARLREANRDGQEKLRASLLAQAHANRWSGRLGRRFGSLEALAKAAAIRPGLELRNEAIAAMALVDMHPVQTIEAPEGTDLLFNHSLSRYVKATRDGRMTLHRVEDGAELLELPAAPQPWLKWEWSHDDRYFVCGFGQSPHHWWVYDVPARRKVLDFTNAWLRTVSFSPDNRRLAVVQRVGGRHNAPEVEFAVFDLEGGTNLHSWPGTGRLPYSIAFNSTGEKLAVSSAESGRVLLLDATTGVTLQELKHGDSTAALRWHPGKDLLAVGCADRNVYLWDIRSSIPVERRFFHGHVVTGLSFHPGGEFLASHGWDNQVHLWHVPSGKELLRAPAWGAARFAPDGHRLKMQPSPRRHEIAQFSSAPERRTLLLPEGAGRADHCAFSPDGRWLVSSHPEGVRVWDVSSRGELAFIRKSRVSAAVMSLDGSSLFVSRDGGIEAWRVDSVPVAGAAVNVRFTHERTLYKSVGAPRVTLDAAGRRLALADNGWARAIEVGTGRHLIPDDRQRHLEEPFYEAAISPDGHWCASHTASGNGLFVWDLDDTNALPRQLHTTSTSCEMFSPDNRWLVSGSGDNYMGWDTASWQRRWTFPRETSGGNHARIAFAPDGAVAAAAWSTHAVRLLDPQSGRELATIESPEEEDITWLAFSPDGALLAVANKGRAIHLWDLRAVRRQLTSMQLDWDAPPLPPDTASPAESVSKIHVLRAAQPDRDPRCTTNQIDLTYHYNDSLTNQTIPGGELEGVPAGLHTLNGIPFDIRGIVRLAAPGLSRSVSGIPVHQPCRSLHFLHAKAWVVNAGPVPIADYVIHYTDGRSERVPLTNDLNIADWWMDPNRPHPLDTNTTVIAWQGESQLSRRYGMKLQAYHFRWDNPRPGISVATIDFHAASNTCHPCLLAITAEP